MGKAQSPLLGFNNNVRHRGRVFHIQTEDSGIKYPHVITHLFADGGRILKSIKTSYAEYLDTEELEKTVRNLMKDQHKSMFIALRDGQFDELFEEEKDKQEPAPVPPENAQADKAKSQDKATAPSASSAKKALKRRAISRPALASQPRAESRGTEPSEPKVDVEVLERAAAAAQNRSPLFEGENMPPPPPAVLASKRPSGTYRALGSDSDQPPPSRYSATRPASIFGTSDPSESSGSVFGEDMISGKSLDEVILSFLSEEFGEPPDKDGGKKGE